MEEFGILAYQRTPTSHKVRAFLAVITIGEDSVPMAVLPEHEENEISSLNSNWMATRCLDPLGFGHFAPGTS
jgi:hypothetical protein